MVARASTIALVRRAGCRVAAFADDPAASRRHCLVCRADLASTRIGDQFATAAAFTGQGDAERTRTVEQRRTVCARPRELESPAGWVGNRRSARRRLRMRDGVVRKL